MRYMERCCCGCCTVETGTKVLSILGIISHVGPFIGTFRMFMYEGDDEWYNTMRKIQTVIDPQTLLICEAVIFGIGILVCALCAIGAFKRQRYYYLPYLVYEAFTLVQVLALFVLFIVIAVIVGRMDGTKSEGEMLTKTLLVITVGCVLVALFIVFVMTFYYFFVVLSDYKNLEFAERHPQPSVQYSSVPGNAPPVYVGQGFPQGVQPGYVPQTNVYPSLPDNKSQAV